MAELLGLAIVLFQAPFEIDQRLRRGRPPFPFGHGPEDLEKLLGQIDGERGWTILIRSTPTSHVLPPEPGGVRRGTRHLTNLGLAPC
jgi:hypothetical protein